MGIRKATHRDVMDYMDLHYGSGHYKVLKGKLIIKYRVNFITYNFDTLPMNLVFDSGLDLIYTSFKTLPDDIVLKGSLDLGYSSLKTLPVLNIGINLDISDTTLALKDGTYIGDTIFSKSSLYKYLDDVEINGYLFSTGVLS